MAKRSFKLKGCPFWYAKANPDLIQKGKIIYVSDTHGVILPYMCPEKIKASVSECTFTRTIDKEEILDDKTILEDLVVLPTYMVGQLLSKYKDKPSFYKVIKKELTCRGRYENKKYKLRREIIEIELEECELNDKYQRRRKVKCKKS